MGSIIYILIKLKDLAARLDEKRERIKPHKAFRSAKYSGPGSYCLGIKVKYISGGRHKVLKYYPLPLQIPVFCHFLFKTPYKLMARYKISPSKMEIGRGVGSGSEV